MFLSRIVDCSHAVFRPLKPMLAQTCEEPGDAVGQLASTATGETALDFKLDGARIQVHKSHEKICVYTRNLRDVTGALPEVVEGVRALPNREIVLDGEVLALQPDGRPHAFQTTMRRFGRKLDVARVRAELPLSPRFFDCLYVDGDALIDRPGAERFAALAAWLPAPLRVRRIITGESDQADAFLHEALALGHEGVMAKSLDAPYAAGSRGAQWLKIKPAHTLDLVVLAADWGHGRRRGWLSNLHLGARNPGGGFTMLGKTFKGMTDEMLRWQTKTFQRLAIAPDDDVANAYTVHVRPEVVVEIALSDVQASTKYDGGFALRLARVKRYRPDKRPEDADTIDTVRRIHTGQRSPSDER